MVTTVGEVSTYKWIWLFIFGILLTILGVVLLATPVIASLATVLALGTLLIVGGILHIVTAFVDRRSDSFWLHLLIAALTIVIGVLMFYHPTATLLALTLLLTAFFLSIGIFRVVSSLTLRFEGWKWVLVNGVISILLGILIMIHWPSSALWVIGLFLGIDFIFAGFSLMMLALSLKKLPAQI